MTARVASGPLTIGQTLGPRYRITRLLGVGGMGAVYQAWDADLGVSVAIKVIRPEAFTDPDTASAVERRFKRELLLARQVTHRNVVRIHDLGEVDGIKYLTMPYIEGRTLADVMRDAGRLPVARALAIARQVAEGLGAAHAASVIHRDLKPENVMIATDGTALIMDFGISRSLGATAGITATGAFVGTLEYMAPEQAQTHEVDLRADIYSLGLIIHDMLSGRRRVGPDENPMTEFMGRVQRPPPPLSGIRPDVPVAVDRLVTRCLAPDPAQRWQSAAAVADAITAVDASHAPSRAGMLGRAARFRAPALAGLALIAVAASAWWFRARATPAPTAPVSVLIASVRNDAGEPLFDGLIEPTLGVGLEAASFLTLYPRRDAERALTQIKPGAVLDDQGSRLVALREGIQRVVSGGITSRRGHYVLTLVVTDPASGTVVATTESSVRDKRDILNAVGRAAARIRNALGDRSVSEHDLSAAETFTAASLEAASAYVRGQELRISGRYDEAITAFEEAIARDPRMGRAYAGLGTIYRNLGRREDALAAFEQALRHLDRMTEREKYRTRGVYYVLTGNATRGREEFEALVRQYPRDNAGLNNVALAYFQERKFARALEFGARAAQVFSSVIPLNNHAWYAMYAGDFRTAREQAARARLGNPTFGKPIIVTALAYLAEGQTDSARQWYAHLERLPAARDLGAFGPADLAMYEGRLEDAATILTRARAAGSTSRSRARRLTALLADVRAAQGRRSEAIALAGEVLDGADHVERFQAGRALLAAGAVDRAHQVAAMLEAATDADARLYGVLLRGEIHLARNEAASAIERFEAARALADTWLGRFGLARAYVLAHRYAEADAELDQCVRRRGEATAAFLDDQPTYHLYPPVTYYIARVREGLRSPAATDAYREFLRIKARGTERGLVADASARLARLGQSP